MRRLDCRDSGDRQGAVLRAVRAAKNGRLVALPAETGYVLVSDAFSGAGVKALQRVKHLDPGTSMGVLVGHPSGVHGIATRLPGAALDLMSAFWPGQVSLLVHTQPSLRWTVPTDRCVVRMPLHPVLLEVAATVGPMVYSAAVTVQERAAAAVLLDCGERPTGPGATLIDATSPQLRLLRPGAVSQERVRAVVPDIDLPSSLEGQ